MTGDSRYGGYDALATLGEQFEALENAELNDRAPGRSRGRWLAGIGALLVAGVALTPAAADVLRGGSDDAPADPDTEWAQEAPAADIAVSVLICKEWGSAKAQRVAWCDPALDAYRERADVAQIVNGGDYKVRVDGNTVKVEGPHGDVEAVSTFDP